MCISEGLINQVHCIDSKCSLKSPPAPITKQDQSLLPCTSFSSTLAYMPVLQPSALLPSTLTQVFPDTPETVKRYIRLVKQKFYERTTATVYCPRETCQHPNIPKDPEAQLIVCAKCTYPFCKFCRASWHGQESRCKPQHGYSLLLHPLHRLGKRSMLIVALWRNFWLVMRRDGRLWS